MCGTKWTTYPCSKCSLARGLEWEEVQWPLVSQLLPLLLLVARGLSDFWQRSLQTLIKFDVPTVLRSKQEQMLTTFVEIGAPHHTMAEKSSTYSNPRTVWGSAKLIFSSRSLGVSLLSSITPAFNLFTNSSEYFSTTSQSPTIFYVFRGWQYASIFS